MWTSDLAALLLELVVLLLLLLLKLVNLLLLLLLLELLELLKLSLTPGASKSLVDLAEDAHEQRLRQVLEISQLGKLMDDEWVTLHGGSLLVLELEVGEQGPAASNVALPQHLRLLAGLLRGLRELLLHPLVGLFHGSTLGGLLVVPDNPLGNEEAGAGHHGNPNVLKGLQLAQELLLVKVACQLELLGLGGPLQVLLGDLPVHLLQSLAQLGVDQSNPKSLHGLIVHEVTHVLLQLMDVLSGLLVFTIMVLVLIALESLGVDPAVGRGGGLQLHSDLNGGEAGSCQISQALVEVVLRADGNGVALVVEPGKPEAGEQWGPGGVGQVLDRCLEGSKGGGALSGGEAADFIAQAKLESNSSHGVE